MRRLTGDFAAVVDGLETQGVQGPENDVFTLL
jgi:hypothetical protein